VSRILSLAAGESRAWQSQGAAPDRVSVLKRASATAKAAPLRAASSRESCSINTRAPRWRSHALSLPHSPAF